MEEYAVKLDQLIPVMNDFIGKLQDFDTLPTNEKKTSAIRDILITVEDLRRCLKNYIQTAASENQTFNNQVELIFSEFNWNVNCTIKPNDYLKFSGCCKSLAASILKMLGKRNCGVLVVEMHFQMCMKLANELFDNVENHENVLKGLLLFQLLIKGFLSTVRVLKKFWYVILPPHKKCSVLLCVNQSFKTLCFLGTVIDKRLNHLITYILNRLKQCFNKVLDLLLTPEENNLNSEFILLMDSCLNKLERLRYDTNIQQQSKTDVNEDVTALKPLIDELLCHAMTVSYISSTKAASDGIKSCSQKVLNEFENMRNSDDLASSAEKLADILCHLEEIVNVSVLNVVLDVFIDINSPLRKIVDKCNQPIKESRSPNDLEDGISNFDEHLDRIMHIGLFAVSCSTNVKKILEIRSCLASLESLEPELITSIISLYLNPNPETRSTFHYIFKNWMGEVTQLKNLIDLILDPVAFSQVVRKRITTLLYEMQDDDSISISKIRSNVNAAVSYTKKLIKTLGNSIEHDDEDIKEKVKVCIEGLQLAYQECKASSALVDQEISLHEVRSRIVKRIELIVTTINNLIQNYSTATNLTAELKNETDSNILPTGHVNIYKISPITLELEEFVGMDVLTPYINKGKLKTKERTILYNTPKHTQRTPVTIDSQISTETRFLERNASSRSKLCRPLPQYLELENSLDLELTALLDKMTDLSNTFKTTFKDTSDVNDVNVDEDEDAVTSDISCFVKSEPNCENDGKVLLGTVMRQKLDQSLNELSISTSLSIHKDSNFQFETPERMNDLSIVQQKINFLIEHMKY